MGGGRKTGTDIAGGTAADDASMTDSGAMAGCWYCAGTGPASVFIMIGEGAFILGGGWEGSTRRISWVSSAQHWRETTGQHR